ncbi:hypothetical protein [Leptospira interrogans]|uniref:Uncharacterized protein n=3 Tax=Leptospira interrogans TaxID=173 RepID=A0AAQ0B019_LEPIR|nr:hypothetical protein [Leptospira interrogans]EKR27545.1 hypothetical protein LEP1GSC087_1209 [Leptospira interrogans serovar Bataviae str. L1111]QOI44947.1 hypothetical protein Lepto782_22310 [Leptospira interrogans serovar Canicola]QOI53368.1 hypothetical protein Lepto1489_23680 [Leptospira interrogans serovar Bataviae]WOT13135.1 hypothetical protein CFY92_0020815 [Leptospira interrogans]
MNKKYIKCLASIIIVVIWFFLFFNCSKVTLPKNPKVISYIIWDKDKPDLFYLTLDYSFQKNLSLSKLSFFELEKAESDDFGKSLNEFSQCAFELIPRNRGDFSLNDAPLIVMLVEDSIDHSRYIFTIGLQNLESKMVFIRRTKIILNVENNVEYKNEGCYQNKNGYQKYVQLIRAEKARKRNLPLLDVLKEYREIENTHSGKTPDLYLRLIFMSFSFLGGIGTMLILLMLLNRTRNFSKKKKLIIGILYGTFCLIVSAWLLF